MPKDKVIIANCSGFWGDDPTAAKRQVDGGPIDYLVMDYLAEITMAIMQKQRQRNPDLGYATDFVHQLRDILPACVERNIRIVANAGGVNPLGCKLAVEGLAKELGLAEKVKVGVVLGDDIYHRLDDILADEPLAHMESGEGLQGIRDRVLSANVYLGAGPVVRALDLGANIVIAGRVTDTSVTLAPLIHEFGWARDDWDRIACGVIAGHIIECGAQCTGGNFTDWHKVPSYVNMGFPTVEAYPDGRFVVSKHPDTGGLVTVHTITEQLLYEMGAPSYLSPDCIARFDSIALEQYGPDRVAVSGIRGEPPPEKLKVSVSTADGFRAFGRLMISGPRAKEKAELVAATLWEEAGGEEVFEETCTQLIGIDACHPALSEDEPGELLLQLAVRDPDKRKIDRGLNRRLVSKVLGSVPGITYLADQGRPRPSDVVGYWPALVSHDKVPVSVQVGELTETVDINVPQGRNTPGFEPQGVVCELPCSGRQREVTLEKLCLARSGDKGDTCNVGVVARSAEIYCWLGEHLTSEFVKRHFQPQCKGDVERFAVPNLLSYNFLLHRSLGGGGTLSLLLDAQGKTFAQYLLTARVTVDAALVETIPEDAA